MATFLLIIIYIAFIGLGIPDSLFGTAIPVIREELNFSVSSAGIITFLVSTGTLISSLFSARIINKLGTAKVTVLSTFLTVLAMIGYSVSRSFLFFCVCAIPMGIGAGAIDSALNNYAAIHYTSRQMSFLHCFFGVGISISPFFMSLTIQGKLGWRGGYYVMIGVQTVIALLLLFSLPLWKKVREKEGAETKVEPRNLTFLQVVKNKSALGSFFILFGSCAIEYVVGTWTSTYLVNGRGVSPETSAIFVALYYVGMTLGRFFSGVIAKKLTSISIIKFGQGICFLGLVTLFLPLPANFSSVSVFLIGLGNGAVFPNMMYLIPINFGVENAQSVMGIQFASANLGIMVMPPLFGVLAQTLSPLLFPFYLVLLFALMILGDAIMLKNLSTAKDFS